MPQRVKQRKLPRCICWMKDERMIKALMFRIMEGAKNKGMVWWHWKMAWKYPVVYRICTPIGDDPSVLFHFDRGCWWCQIKLFCELFCEQSQKPKHCLVVFTAMLDVSICQSLTLLKFTYMLFSRYSSIVLQGSGYHCLLAVMGLMAYVICLLIWWFMHNLSSFMKYYLLLITVTCAAEIWDTSGYIVCIQFP